MALRRAAERSDLVAAEQVAALAGQDSPEAIAGALTLVEAARWIIAIGRGLGGR